MTLDDVEAVIWQVSTAIGEDGKPCRLLTPAAVDEILAAVDAHAKATPKAPAARKPPLPQKPPAVHFAADGDHPACLPFDRSTGRTWAFTVNPGLVTCGRCRKKEAWRDAEALAGMEKLMTRGAP